MKYLLIGLGLIVASASQAALFDWENLTASQVNGSFSQTVDGITATVTGVGGNVSTLAPSPLPFGGVSVAGGVASPSNSWKPTKIEFSSVVSNVTAWFGDNGPDNDGNVTLAAFDINGQFITSSTIFRGTITTAQSLTVLANGIKYVIGSTDATVNPHSVVWDNVFTPVPEPATMIALGLPALALLRRNRRK